MTKQRDMRLAMMYAEELRQSVRGDCAPSSGLMLSVAALLERFGLPDEPPAECTHPDPEHYYDTGELGSCFYWCRECGAFQSSDEWLLPTRRLAAPPAEPGLQSALGEALRELFDEQNGPPLETRRVQWESAHRKARAALQWYDASVVRAVNRQAEPPADPLRENLIAALAAADAEECDEERWAEFSRIFRRAHLNRTAEGG